MVYFSMAEWDFLEEQRDLYKDVMMDNQQLLSYVNLGKNNLLLSEMILNLTLSQPDGSSKRNPPERCPRPLYSRDPTQEDHNYAHRFQGKDLIDLKVEVNVEQTYVGGDQSTVEMVVPLREEEPVHVTTEDRPLITSPDGSSKRNPPERCPRPLYSRDPTQEHHEIPQTRLLYSWDPTQEHHKIPQTCPLYSRDPTQEHHEIPQTCPLYSRDPTQEHHEIPQTRPLYSRDPTQEHHEIPQTCPLYSRDPTQEHHEIPQTRLLYSRDPTQEHHEIPQTRPLYSEDSTQEDHNYAQPYQCEDRGNMKAGNRTGEEEEVIGVRGDPPSTEDVGMMVTGIEEESSPGIAKDGSSTGESPERGPRPLDSRDSTLEDHNYAQHYQCEDLTSTKADNKAEEEEETNVRGDHQSTEEAGVLRTENKEEPSPEITQDGSRNPPERCPRPLYSRDPTQEDLTVPHHDQVGGSEGHKDIMMEPPIKRNPPERCPRALYSWDPTQEDLTISHHDERKYLEGHRDLYKDVMMENEPPLTSPDGSSKRNPPERCPRPLYSRDPTQEDLTVPHHDQDEELKIKVKKEEEETHVTGEQRASEEVEMMDTDKEEESSPDVRSDGHSVRNSSEGDPILPPDYKAEDDDITQHSPGVNPVPHKRHRRPSCLETSMDPSDPEEPSDPSQTRTSCGPLVSHRVDRSEDPSNLVESSKDGKGDLPGEDLWACLECGKRFTKNRALIKHQRMHQGGRPFSCTECGKCFTVKGELLRHQRLHTGEEHFSCSDFRRCFNRKGKLNIDQKILTDDHQKILTGDHSFSCLACGKCFVQKGDLLEHRRIHTGKHPFTCSECKKCFIEKRTLLIHHTSHTGEHPHSCLDCGKCFTRNNTLIRHQRSHTGEHPFSCSECGKCFVQEEHLRRHQKIHTYGKGFSVKGSLLLHKSTHKGERPFPCSECGKCFAAKGKLLIHQRIHRGGRPYSCPECGKCFSVKRGLLIHQRVHMGEHPFLCSACGKCFAEKGSLLKHQRHHAHKGPFPCTECGKSFKQKENLIRHQSTHSC